MNYGIKDKKRCLTICMIAYLLLRRRDATYNYPLPTSRKKCHPLKAKSLSDTLLFCYPEPKPTHHPVENSKNIVYSPIIVKS